MLKATGVYTQPLASNQLDRRDCSLIETRVWDPGAPPGGVGAYFLVTGMAGGVENSLGSDSAGDERPNDAPCP